MNLTEKIPATAKSLRTGAFVLALLAAAFFCLTSALYTTSFWSISPYYDEWRNIPFAVDIATGHFNPLTLFAPDDGYTVLWFRIATVLETVFFHYDPRFSIAAGFAFLIGSAALLIFHYRKLGTTYSSLAIVAVCAMIFSLENWENFLAPWLINYSAVFFFMLVTLLTIAERKLFAVALVSAVMCSLSFANGMVIWPCAIFILWTQRRFTAIGLFALLAGLTIARVLAVRISGATGQPFDVANAMLRFLTVVGFPLVPTNSAISAGPTDRDASLSVAIGTVVCMLILWALFLTRRIRTPGLAAPLAILAFGIGSCALIGAGRSWLPDSQAMSSRYYITSSIVYIGLFMLVAERSFDNMSIRPVIYLLSLAIIATSLFALRSERVVGPYRKKLFDDGRDQVLNYKTVQPSGPLFRLPPKETRDRIEMMERLHLGPFRD